MRSAFVFHVLSLGEERTFYLKRVEDVEPFFWILRFPSAPARGGQLGSSANRRKTKRCGAIPEVSGLPHRIWQAKLPPCNRFTDRQAEALALELHSELTSAAVLGESAGPGEASVLG